MAARAQPLHLENYKKTGAEFMLGTGRFIAPRTVEATLPNGTTRQLRGKNVIVNTGTRAAFEQSGASAVMLARGSLGNPWLFERLLGERGEDPSTDEVLDELDWVVDCAADHFGPERAARYLRKFYPWYLDRMGAPRSVYDALQRSDGLDRARALLAGLRLAPAAA